MNYNYKQVSNANQYLMRFDEILCQMTDKMLSSKITNSITLDFIQNMIPHHQAAIYMSENLLQYCIDPRLKCVANTIIKEQSEGVRELENIRKIFK